MAKRITLNAKRVVLPWMAVFSASAAEVFALEGAPTEAVVELTVPGQLRENGTPNNKGNALVLGFPSQLEDMLLELRQQSAGTRQLTPQECVRRSFVWENQGSEEEPKIFACFRASEAKGSRTMRVPREDLGLFIDAFRVKVSELEDLWEEHMNVGEGEEG